MQKIIRVDEEKEEFLEDLSVDCYVLSDNLSSDFCLKFTGVAHKQEKIVLFYGEDAVQFCKKYDADGVIVDFGADDLKNKMTALRKELGKDKYIGLFTRNRRHESMLVSEVEPDFVVFKVWKDGFLQVQELVNWYNEFFLIQSAVWMMDEGIDLSSLKADFVIE